MRKNTSIKGLDFSKEEIVDAIQNKRALSFDLELTHKCNLRCIYCYAESGKPLPNEMHYDKILSVIEQAKSLGAKKAIIIGGGEPLLYDHYFDVISAVRKSGMSSVTFTNGTCIDMHTAKKLFEFGEDIALKLNSFNPSVQDHLAGNIQGTGDKILNALRRLLDVGYSSHRNAPKLALETIICKANYDEIFDIYKFCREHDVTPYIEMLTVQGNAKRHVNDLYVSSEDCYKLFKELLAFDEERYGITWPLTPPIAGQNCKRMLYSFYVTSQGYVQPCPGVAIHCGNIHDESVFDIIRNSEVFHDVRNIYKRIQGACGNCEESLSSLCYGCRGAAYHHSGNYLDEDPTCWKICKTT